MNKIKSKIRAFTLLELSVVMAISGVVFAIAYSAYGIINQQFYKFKIGNEKVIQASTAYAVLYRDFSEAREIKRNGSELLFNLYNNSEIVYRFENDFIARIVNDQEDIFEVASNLKLSFSGKEQTDNEGIIDELYFEIGIEALPVHLKKYYGAELLMAIDGVEN